MKHQFYLYRCSIIPKDAEVNYSDRKQINGCLGVDEAVGKVGRWGLPRVVIIPFASGERHMLSLLKL